MSLLIPTITFGPTYSEVGHIHSIAYQRNGCGGKGFYVVEFQGRGEAKERTFWAVVTFENDDDTIGAEAFVFDPAKPGDGWRGTDYFGPDLFKIVRAAKWQHEIDRENEEKAQKEGATS